MALDVLIQIRVLSSLLASKQRAEPKRVFFVFFYFSDAILQRNAERLSVDKAHSQLLLKKS